MVVQSRKAAYTLAFQVFEYEDNRGCEVTGSISSTLAAEPIYLGNLLIYHSSVFRCIGFAASIQEVQLVDSVHQFKYTRILQRL